MNKRTQKNLNKVTGGDCPSAQDARREIAHDLWANYGVPSTKCNKLANLIYTLASIPVNGGISPKAEAMLGITSHDKQSMYGYSKATAVMRVYRQKTQISPIIARALNSFADRNEG